MSVLVVGGCMDKYTRYGIPGTIYASDDSRSNAAAHVDSAPAALRNAAAHSRGRRLAMLG